MSQHAQIVCTLKKKKIEQKHHENERGFGVLQGLTAHKAKSLNKEKKKEVITGGAA